MNNKFDAQEEIIKIDKELVALFSLIQENAKMSDKTFDIIENKFTDIGQTLSDILFCLNS